MLSYFYCRKLLQQYYGQSSKKMPKCLKQFAWAEGDFVATPTFESEMSYEYLLGLFRNSGEEM